MTLLPWLGIAAAVATILVLWRVRSWPCPPWLIPLLENPYFQAVASSERLLDRAGVQPGMTVLDAGCGPGRVTIPAARRVGPSGRVTALDLQRGMLRRLEERLVREGLQNVDLVHGGLGTGLLPAGTFDAALLVTVLGEIPDPDAALAELCRALRPGGVLSVTEVLPDPHYQRLRRVRMLAARTGFEELAVFDGRVGYTLNLVRGLD